MESKLVKLIEAGSRMMITGAQGEERGGGGNKRCWSNGPKFQLHKMNEFWSLRCSMMAIVNSAALYP